jgi:acetyl-CoA carboxylase biotin carboxyl carrier protein
MSTAKPEDIESLIKLFDESNWDGLRISSPNCQLYLSKDASQVDRYRKSVAGVPTAAAPHQGAPSVALTSAKPAARSAKPTAAEIPEGMIVVRAPNLGTFYQASKPGADPYVVVGQEVEADTEVCIIEVMKLFTAVRAGVAGIVRQILATDGQLVEFDQPLLVIEPNG